jgi:hypothetical protein
LPGWWDRIRKIFVRSYDHRDRADEEIAAELAVGNPSNGHPEGRIYAVANTPARE